MKDQSSIRPAEKLPPDAEKVARCCAEDNSGSVWKVGAEYILKLSYPMYDYKENPADPDNPISFAVDEVFTNRDDAVAALRWACGFH